MNLYVWINDDTETDFEEDFPLNERGDPQNAEFGYHSGAIVVLADSVEQARELANDKENTEQEPAVIIPNRAGVVVRADGEC